VSAVAPDAARSQTESAGEPALRWCSVERTEPGARLAAALGETRSVIVVVRGPAGIGKTSLVLDTLGRSQVHHVVVRATAGLDRVPLAALHPLLWQLGVAAPDEGDVAGAALLGELWSALDSRADRTVVFVDDAPRLDPASAAIVAQLADHPRVHLVLTVRDDDTLGQPLAGLLDRPTARRVAVGALSFEECAAVVATSLGEQIDPATTALLHERSGGNPLYLRELVTGSVEAGRLVSGPHGLTLSSPVPSRRLVELVAEHLERLGASRLAALELLAVAQPLDLADLAHVGVEADDLVELERVGLVAADRTGSGVEVRLGHPVHEEVLRAVTPAIRWSLRLRDAAVLLWDRGDPSSRFRATCMRVDAGEPVGGAELVAAARRAFGLLDHRGAIVLANAATAAGEPFWGSLVLGGASSALGDAATADEALERALVVAADDEQRALAAQRLGMHLAVRLERPTDALARAEQVLDSLGDERWRRFLAADVAKWRMMAGLPIDDLVATALPGEPPSEDPAVRLNDRVLRALVTVMNGELTLARAAVDEGLPIAVAHPEILPNAEDLLRLSGYLVMTFAGELREATALAEEQLAHAARRRGEPEGMWSFALSLMELHRGRVGRAVELSTVAVSRLEWRDFTGLRPVARAVRATGLAQLGRPGDARRELDSIEDLARQDPKVDLQVAQAEAWLAVADRDHERAIEALADAGRRAMASQHLCLGALTSYEAVRLGGAEAVVRDLCDAAARSEGRLVAALAEHAVAAVDRDAAALESISDRLWELGLAVASVDAAAQAARLHRRAGRAEPARRAARRAERLDPDHDGARGTPDEQAEPGLTPRERQVAQLAAQRWRSREVAEQLQISVRTVDNHLASAYRKLGVTDRTELAEVLDELGLRDAATSQPDPSGGSARMALRRPGAGDAGG
jgi:DNA-binding CsgD family transcriptional regulator